MVNNFNNDKIKICFVIGPIGEADSETRKRSDQILNHIIKPIVNKFDYEVLRSDTISEPGSINHKIIENILNSELVIADLSDQNANVFYELALRHTVKKPFIQIAIRGQKNPFDVFDLRTIEIDLHDLDKVEMSKNEIENQLKSIHVNGMDNVKTPISLSLELLSLNQSGDVVQKSLAELIQQVSTFQSKLNSIELKIEKKRNIILTEKQQGFMTNLFEPKKEFVGYIEGEDQMLESLLDEEQIKKVLKMIKKTSSPPSNESNNVDSK